MCRTATCLTYLFNVLLLLSCIFVNDVKSSASASVTPLQVILNSVAEESIEVDGFQGVQLSNIWNSKCCTATSCSCSSGWESASSLQTTFANTKLTSQKVQINVEATIDKTLSLNVSISFTGSLSLEVGGHTFSSDVFGLVYKAVSDIPVPAIANFPLTWSGWLQGSSYSSLYVNDANLFDGVPAVLMTNPQSSSIPNLSQLVSMVADPAKRFGVLNGVPSTNFGDTLRDKFLNGSWLSVDSSVSGSLIFTNSSRPSIQGSFVTMSGSCDTSCGFSMSVSLTKFVNGAVGDRCQSLSVVGPTVSSNTSIDFFIVGSSSVMIRSFSSRTQAVFRCNQGSNATFIGLSLSSTQVFSEAQWPLSPFMNDAQAAVGMLQSLPLQAKGFLWGSVTDDEETYSLVRSDIFSANGGGVLVADQLIGKSGNDTTAAVEQVQSLFSSICSLLETDVKPLNSSLSSLFPINGVEKLLRNYQAVAPSPSVIGFIQWFVAGNEGTVDVHISSEQIVLVLNVSVVANFKQAASAFSNSSTAYQQINSTFTSLVQQVLYKYPGIENSTEPLLDGAVITGWHAIWLTSSIIITRANNTFNASLGASDMSEVAAFSAAFKAKSFFSKRPLFSEASVTFEHGNVDIEATIEESEQHKIGTTVGLTTDNKLVLTNTPGPNSTSILLSLQDIAANLSTISTENANAYINYDITSLCGQNTWEQAMTGCSQLEFDDNPSAFEFRDSIAQYLDDLCEGTNTTVVVTLQSPRDSSFVISIVTSTVQDVSLNYVGNPWEQVTDTSRLVMPIGLRTCVQLKVGNSSVLGFDVEGSNTVVGWTLPFSYNMLLGSTTGNSSMTVTLDLPDILLITASFPVSSSFGEEAMGSIYVKMDSGSQEAQIGVTTDTRLQVPATFVVNNLVDGLFQLLPNAMAQGGPADISVGSAFQNNFASQNTFSNLIDKITPWLSITSDLSPMLTQSEMFCAGSPLDSFTLSISVNQMAAISCVVTPTNDTSVMDAIINSAFASCGLQPYLTAEMVYWEDNCGTIGLYPSSPGLVWSLNINTTSTLFSSPAYLQTPIPAFGSWQDLVHILSSCSLDLGAPEVTFIPSNATPDLLPQQLSSVYPPEFPAITFPITIRNLDSNIVMPLSSQVTADNIQLQSVYSNLTFVGNLQTMLRGSVAFVSGLPPMGGGVNISVLTCFTSANQTMQYLVPGAPNNTFDVIIKAEIRSPDMSVTPISVEQTITLTPGTPALTALAQALAQQLPPIAQPLVEVAFYPALFPNLQYSFDQIRISVSRYTLNNGSWVIPQSLAISNPLFPALSNTTVAPVTIMMLTEDLSMHASTSLNSENVSIVAMAGTLGMLDVRFNDLVGGGSIQLEAPTLNKYHSIISLGSAVASQFYSQFSISFNVSVKLQAEDLSVQYAAQIPDGSSVPFVIKGSWSLENSADVTKMLQELAQWNVTITKPFLVAAQQLEDKVICNWATLLEQRIMDVINFPKLSTSPLPFVDASVGVAFEQGIGTAISNVKTQICQSPQTITLSTMCSIMQNSLGFNPCGDLHLGAKIMLDLNIVGFNYSHLAAFQLDTHSVFGGSLPFAMGLSDSISFNTLADLDIKLDIEFDIGRDPNITLGPSATAVFSVGFSLTGSVVASLGPLQLGFGGIEMLLGGANYASTPAVMTARFTESGVQVNIDGSAMMSAQTLLLGVPICQFSVKVPNIAGYLRNPKGSGLEVDYPNCNGGFIEQIEEAIEKNTLLAFFSQPLMLIRTIEQAVAEFLSVVFGVRGIVGDVELPLVGKLVELIVASEINAIVGPKALGALVSNIAGVTSTLQHVQTLNTTYIDELVLQGITKAICTAFVSSGLMTRAHCPAVPPITGDTYAWSIQLGRAAGRQTQLFSFHLGGHGFASLNSECAQQLNMNWQFDFVLQYSRRDGLSIQFPTQPIFQSDISLKLASCLLSGKIGFMAAEFIPTGAIQGKFEVATFQQATLDFNAELDGDADFGFTTNMQELTMYPYWQVHVGFKWAWSLSNRQMAPIFTVSQGKVCAGHYLTKVLTQVLNKAQVIIKPMESVLGPNSLLLKPIPVVKYIIGHELTYLDFCVMIVRTFCSSCYVTGVEAVEIFLRVMNTLNDLQALVDNQCDSYNQLKDFALDFTQPITDNIIQSSQPDPPVGLNFVPNTPAAQNAGTFQQHWQNFNGGDPKYGVNFDIMNDPVRKLLDMILGVNVPLISVNVPPLSIYIHVSWQFLIYPPIWLVVGFSSGVKVNVAQIAFTSAALTRTLETGSPGNLFNSIAIPANNQVFDAYGRLSGGICVSFFIKGCASVFIQLEAQVNTLNPDGDGWVTFDEIFWLHHHNGQNDNAAFAFDLTLSAGIEISLKICIHLIFKKKCWNIYHHSWSAVIYRYQYGPSSYVPSIHSDGSFDMGTALMPPFSSLYLPSPDTLEQLGSALAEQAQYRIYSTPDGCRSVDIFPPGVDPSNGNIAPYTRCTDPSIPVSTYGSPGGAAFSMDIQGVTAAVNIPPSSLASVTVQLSSYDPGFFSITPQAVTPPSATGIFIPQCNNILLYDPPIGTGFTLTGIQCPVTIQSTPLSNITIAGNQGDYGGRVVTIMDDAYNVVLNVPANEFTLSDTTLLADSGINVAIPSTTSNILVLGSAINSQFHVTTVAPSTTLTITGGSTSVFNIAQIGKLYGRLILNGGAQISELNTLTMSVYAADGNIVTCTPTAFVQTGGATQSLVTYSNIGYRDITYYGASGVNLVNTIVTPEPAATINIWSVGVADGTSTHMITGCGAGGVTQVDLSGPGAQTVVIGQTGDLSAVQCTVLVHGSLSVSQSITLNIDATSDSRALSFTYHIGSLLVSNPAKPADFFNIQFSNVAQVIVNHGSGNTVLMGAVTQNFVTEYQFIFPDAPTSPCSVTINALPNAMVIHGSATVIYTAQPGSNTPFDNVPTMVALVGAINVVVTSATGSVPNNYGLDSSCLNLLDGSHAVVPPTDTPSSWMCGLLTQYGFNDGCRKCQIKYLGNTAMDITTANGNDYFYASSPKAQISLTTLAGDDTVYWEQGVQAPASTLDVGVGTDQLTIIAPCNTVYTVLGPDHDTDVLDFYLGSLTDVSPSFNGSAIAPVGPSATEALFLSQYNEEDLVSINNALPPTLTRPLGLQATVPLKISVPKTRVTYNMQSSTTYQVVALAAGSTLVLQGTNTDDPNNPPAQNWEVQVVLTTLNTDTYLNIWSTKGSNGIVTVNVPSDSKIYTIYVSNSAADGLGFVTLGGLRIQLSAADHLRINSPQTVNIIVDDTPSDMDLVIAATPTSFVNLQVITNPVFLLNTAATISPSVLSGPYVVYFYGEASLNIDGSEVPQVHFADGMVSVFGQTNNAISSWFAQQLTAAGVSSNLLPASTVIGILKSVNVSVNSAFVNVTGTGLFVASSTYFTASVNGHLLLTDNTAWLNSQITGPTLAVDSRYKLTMTGGAQNATLVFNSVNQTNFVVQCGTPNAYVTTWWLHNDTTSTDYTWQGQSCNGFISMNKPIPVIQFIGQGFTNVHLSLLGNVSSQNPRNVTVSGRSLVVQAQEGDLTFSVDATHQVLVNTLVSQSINNVILDYTANSQGTYGTFDPDSCSPAQAASGTMLISDLTNQFKLCVAAINDGALSVYDSVSWNQASINSSLLTVDQRYHLLLVDYHNTLLFVRPTAATLLTVLCGTQANKFTMWKLAGETTGVLSWNGASCGGSINSPAYPKLLFAGAGSPITAYVELPSTTPQVQRTTSIDNSTMSLSTPEVPSLVITTDTTTQLLVLLNFSAQANATSSVELSYPSIPNGVISNNVPSTCLTPYLTTGQSVFAITSAVDNTTYCFAVAGQVLMSDTQQWAHTTVQGGNLNVPSRYQFSVLGGPNSILGGRITTLPLLDSTTTLEITCGAYLIANQSVQWNILGSNVSASSLAWNSQSCTGSISVHTLPLVLFSGVGQTIATLDVSDSTTSRSVLLQNSNIFVNSTSAVTHIETNEHVLFVTLAFSGGVNTVITNYTQTSVPIASSAQYRSACAATTATSKILLSNTVDSITPCVTVSNTGNVVLEDPYTWENVSISSSVLTLPGRYQLELLTFGGLVVEPIITAQTALDISCGQCSSNGCPLAGAVWWDIGGTDAQQLSWNSTFCGGALVTSVYPITQFIGSGSTNVKADFTVATAAYNNVVINAQNVNISASADPASLLTMSTDNQHQLFVLGLLSQSSQLQLIQSVGTTYDSSVALAKCRTYSSSSAVFVATGLSNSLQLCLVGKSLNVVDTIPWSNANVVADVLTLPARYQLNLVGIDVTFFPLISGATLLDVICGGQASTTQIAAWNIQNYSPAVVYPSANITSTASACTVAVGGVVLPLLLYSGPGSTVVNANLLPDNVAQRAFNFAAGFFNVSSDNTQPIIVMSDTVHNLQVMVNATQGQNTLVLGYSDSQTNSLDTPAILSTCTTAAQAGSPSVAVSSAGDNATYCFISAQGSIVVSDASILSHAIITGFTWHVPQRYRVDLINWEDIFINPPVTTDSMIEVQCGIPSNVQNTPYWNMGMNQISNVTWKGVACQGVITNLFPTYNFTGEGSTDVFADLVSSSPEDVVVRHITAGPNSLRVEILPDVANVSIYSTHPIYVSLSLTGGANSFISTYPISSNNVSYADNSGCVADPSSTAALSFSNMIDNNTYCLVSYDGLVYVEDAEQWAETIINSTTLSVPFRYNVELLQWEGVYFMAFTNDSVVNIYCNEPNATTDLAWRIGTNTTASTSSSIDGPIVWHSASCNGVATNLFPQLIFNGNGTTNVTITVDDYFTPSSITLQTLAMLTESPYAYLSSDGAQIVQLDLMIEGQGTELVLDRYPVSEFVPRLNADFPVKISSLRASSVTLAGQLKFHVDTSSIESNPINTNQTSCVAPHLQCQKADFVDMKILGAKPCATKTAFRDCFNDSVLFINTNHSLTCSSPSNENQWSLNVVTTPQETHYADAWLFPVVIAVFGYGVLCFAVGLCIGPALINAGLLEVAILASLKHVHSLISPYWNLKVRILVVSGYEVVYNLFTGWFCGEDSRVRFFSNILHVIPVYTAIGLAGAVIILILLALIIRSKLWDKINHKRVPAWMEDHCHWLIHVINMFVALAVWLIPFAISHATLAKPYAYEILLAILLIPLIMGLSRCFHFKIAPLSMLIPLIVLPAVTRDDVHVPALVIFSLAAGSILMSTISATLRRLPLCSSVPDKRPGQIQAIDKRLYPHRRFNMWLFSIIIPLRVFGDFVGLGFLFTILFFPHFFTVILWLIWAGISVLAGTLVLLPAVWAAIRHKEDLNGNHGHYVPVTQDTDEEADPEYNDLAYPNYGTQAIIEDYSTDNNGEGGNESDSSEGIFHEDPSVAYSLNQ